MKKLDLASTPLNDLVELFLKLSEMQGEALIDDDTRRYSQLYKQLTAINHELRARGPEARLSLQRLFSHKNAFVRMNAAVKILGLVPIEGRAILQQIDDSRVQPEALHAGMILLSFDRGEWVPD